MISKYKKLNTKSILLGVIIVVVIGGLGIALNISRSQVKTPTSIAEEFGRKLYSVDAEKVDEYNELMEAGLKLGPIIGTPSENGTIFGPNEEYISKMQFFDRNIQPLMTKRAYEGIIANRLNTFSSSICAKGNYTLQVTDFILDKNLYGEKEDKAGYYYEAKLKFISNDGKGEEIDSTKGYIGLLKENGQWKVSIYDLTERTKYVK